MTTKTKKKPDAKTRKRLTLNKETVRDLSVGGAKAGAVRGGARGANADDGCTQLRTGC